MFRVDPFVNGEYYHLYNRGIDKRIIFKIEGDYKRFIMLLFTSNSNDETFRLDNLINRLHKKFNELFILDKGEPLISIGAWCLMPNHFHLLVRQEVDGGITKFMRKLGVGYSMFFNIKYKRQGALFGGPFKSKLIGASDNYMRQLFAYIHLNPLDIKFSDWEKEVAEMSNQKSDQMNKFLQSYEYSSYLDYADIDRVEKNILAKKEFPDYFEDTNSFKDFIESYLSNKD